MYIVKVTSLQFYLYKTFKNGYWYEVKAALQKTE